MGGVTTNNANAAMTCLSLWDIDIAGPLQFPRWRGIFLLVRHEPVAVLISPKLGHEVWTAMSLSALHNHPCLFGASAPPPFFRNKQGGRYAPDPESKMPRARVR